jgi:hypothetical protein
LQARVPCGSSCLLALFAVSSNQERSASKQLAPQLPYTQSQSALVSFVDQSKARIRQFLQYMAQPYPANLYLRSRVIYQRQSHGWRLAF